MAVLSAQLIKQQEINVQNMNVELVAQMFKNYQSNVLFHLEGQSIKLRILMLAIHCHMLSFFTNNIDNSHRQPEGSGVMGQRVFRTILVQHTEARVFV
jgi:DASH complex subunit DAD4